MNRGDIPYLKVVAYNHAKEYLEGLVDYTVANDYSPFFGGLTLEVKKLVPEAIIPTRDSNEAAGLDLYAIESMEIPPHTTRKIHTGWAMAIPKGYFGAIFARSGMATKQGLRPANCVGVIDSDYRGEVVVVLHNDLPTTQYVTTGTRVAQLILMEYPKVQVLEVDELDVTVRGAGGFGSTGV